MAVTLIEDVVVEGLDSAGNPVLRIYAKKPPEYLVYRDPTRVMVHFADNDRVERRQRAALAVLNPLRGQISGLIDGWHNSDDPAKQARADRYERRVADAIVMGLEGGESDAVGLLGEIRSDVIAERRSMAQTDYLMVAALAGGALLLIIFLLSRYLDLNASDEALAAIWTGASGGVLGAFFSIAIGLRSRSILIDLQQWDNRRDAILRIAVGTIGGAILICLFLTGLFSLGSIKFVEPGPSVLITALMFGFLAGFSERAVPDLLAKTTMSTVEAGKIDTALTQAVAAAAVTEAKGSSGSLSSFVEDEEEEPDVPPSDEEDVDVCLTDQPPIAGLVMTTDAELPIASGGVSADAPAGPVPAPAPVKEKTP